MRKFLLLLMVLTTSIAFFSANKAFAQRLKVLHYQRKNIGTLAANPSSVLYENIVSLPNAEYMATGYDDNVFYVDFDLSPTSTRILNFGTNSAQFIAKLDSNLKPLKITPTIQGVTVGGLRAYYSCGTLFDYQRNVYCGCDFAGRLDVKNLSQSNIVDARYAYTTSTPRIVQNSLISKYDSSGNLKWYKNFIPLDSVPDLMNAYVTQVNKSGEVYVHVTHSIGFSMDSIVFLPIISSTSRSNTILKLDSNGNLLRTWQVPAQNAVDSSFNILRYVDQGISVNYDGEFYMINAYIGDSIPVDPWGIGTDTVSNTKPFNQSLTPYTGNFYIAKFDSDFNYVKYVKLESDLYTYSNIWDITPSGDIIVSGKVSDTLRITPSNISTPIVGNQDTTGYLGCIFFVCFDKNLNHKWSYSLPDTVVGYSYANPSSTGMFNHRKSEPKSHFYTIYSFSNPNPFDIQIDSTGNLVNVRNWAEGIPGMYFKSRTETGGVIVQGQNINRDTNMDCFGGDITILPASAPTLRFIALYDSSDYFVPTTVRQLRHTRSNFSLYPNPANTLTNIQFLGDDAFSAAQVAVYDISGKEIIKTTMTDKLLQLKTEAFAAGIYTVQITTKTSVQHQKLVIER